MSRLIVVTGAGSGIGKATAGRFAANHDKVLLVGRRQHRLDEVAAQFRATVNGCDVDRIALDLSDLSAITGLQEHVERLGVPVSGLLCCAGGAPLPDDGGLKSVVTEWQQTYQANVMTAVLAVQGLEHLMSDGASIVLYSSIAAYRGSGGTGAYGAAKSALHSYAHTLAARLGPRGINVNVIAPGYVAGTEFFGNRLTDARKAMLIQQTALGRPGMPQDIAELGFFLCSTEGAYITSQILQINGGSSHGV
jgi:3-oxoacyl-[acyl-carrier protein] reductase